VRVGLDLAVSTPELSGGTVPVILKPVVPAGQLPLGGVQPLAVRLWVETTPAGDAPARSVTAPVEVVVAPDAGELRPPVFLPEGLDLRAGQRLSLRAIDRDSGLDLGTLGLTLLVDWE